MTHQKVINIVYDAVNRFNRDEGLRIKEILEKSRHLRELFSYKFPASGLNRLDLDLNEIIESCQLLCEIAQYQSELLEKSYDKNVSEYLELDIDCLLYTSPSPRDLSTSRMPSSA